MSRSIHPEAAQVLADATNFDEPTQLDMFRSLDVPIPCMTGKRSTASARRGSCLPASVLLCVGVMEFDELGPLVGWQNMAISAALLAIMMARATAVGYSPLELLSERADAAFVATLREWRRRARSVMHGQGHGDG